MTFVKKKRARVGAGGTCVGTRRDSSCKMEEKILNSYKHKEPPKKTKEKNFSPSISGLIFKTWTRIFTLLLASC